MREIFVLNHVASSATNPRKVAQALADYEQSPSLTHFCVLLFIDPSDLPAKFFQEVVGAHPAAHQPFEGLKVFRDPTEKWVPV